MNYRTDIDGIRAIAVTTVILFHYGVAGFTGGFVGVDIFFVLSGFLIGSIVFNQIDKQKFSFSEFYFRRIRRLFPVYVVVMLVTLVLAFLYMLPREFREFGQSLFASTIYISNILFFLEAGYFDTASHLKPLLHTWSLSVEEQFYLVFPVLAWLLSRFSRKHLFFIFGFLTLASFIAALSHIERDTSAVFYLYPFRAWEMFLGTLLATGFIPQVKSKNVNNLIAIVGLGLLLLPIALYTDKTLFPGLAALVPCLGTVLIIYSGSVQQGWLHQLLSMKAPVFIGKLSYSLYLWHWPFYVIYAYANPEGLSSLEIMGILLATFFASLLTYIYIETPFRHGRIRWSNSKAHVFGATAIFSFAAMGVGFYIHKTNGVPQRLNAETAAFAKAGGELFGNLSDCKLENNTTLPGIGYCPMGDPLNSESYTLIWGDSHGGAYRRGYSSLISNEEFPALLAWTGGCPAVLGLAKDELVSSQDVDEECSVRNNAVLELIKNDNRINAVVIVGRWSYYIHGTGIGVDEHNRIALWPEGGTRTDVKDQAKLYVDALHKTIASLNALGKKVFVLEQPPEFEQYLGRTIAIGLMKGSETVQSNLETLTKQQYSQVRHRQGPAMQMFEEAQEQGLMTLLRSHHYFCDGASCSLMVDGSPTYFDNNHVSSFGAEQINDVFMPVLEFLEQPKAP